MKTRFALAALAAACLSTVAAAQMGGGMNHPGMGPGMGGQGMGPGMMGGPGKGPAMMGGMDCPMGQGMMGGRGHGPGMMGGRHGGGGRMGGPGLKDLEALNLTDEQRGQMKEIRRDLQRRNHALMASLRETRWKGQDLARSGPVDVAAAKKLYDEGAAVHKQMFEARIEARAKAEAVLTKEQREQLRKGPPA